MGSRRTRRCWRRPSPPSLLPAPLWRTTSKTCTPPPTPRAETVLASDRRKDKRLTLISDKASCAEAEVREASQRGSAEAGEEGVVWRRLLFAVDLFAVDLFAVDLFAVYLFAVDLFAVFRWRCAGNC